MNGDSRPRRDGADHAPEVSPSRAPAPKLLERLGQANRVWHYSSRTKVAYRYWVRRFILFHDKRHPSGLAAPEIATFLNHLAAEEHVSASTQNQALCAIVFLYRNVLEQEAPRRVDLDFEKLEIPVRGGKRRGAPRAVSRRRT